MSIVFSDEESALLDRIAIDMELDRLSPIDRALIEFRFAYHLPDDYVGPWPPGKYATGEYVGRKCLGRPMSGTTTHERTTRVLERWKRRYHAASAEHSPVTSRPITPILPLSSATRPTTHPTTILPLSTAHSRAA